MIRPCHSAFQTPLLLLAIAAAPAIASGNLIDSFSVEKTSELPRSDFHEAEAGVPAYPIEPVPPGAGQILYRQRLRGDIYVTYLGRIRKEKWKELSFFRLPDSFPVQVRTRFYDRSGADEDVYGIYFLPGYVGYPNAERLFIDRDGRRESIGKEPLPPALLGIDSRPPALVEIGGKAAGQTPLLMVADFQPALTVLLKAPGRLSRSELIALKPGEYQGFGFALLSVSSGTGHGSEETDRLLRFRQGMSADEAEARASDIRNLRFHLEVGRRARVAVLDDSLPKPARSLESDQDWKFRLESWEQERRKETAPVDSLLARCDTALATLARWQPRSECGKDTLRLDPRTARLDSLKPGFDSTRIHFSLQGQPLSLDFTGKLKLDAREWAVLKEGWNSARLEALFWKNATIRRGDSAWKVGLDTVLLSLGSVRYRVSMKEVEYPSHLSGHGDFRSAAARSARLRKACDETPCRGFWSCNVWPLGIAGATVLAAGGGYALYGILHEEPEDPPPQTRKYKVKVDFQGEP